MSRLFRRSGQDAKAAVRLAFEVAYIVGEPPGRIRNQEIIVGVGGYAPPAGIQRFTFDGVAASCQQFLVRIAFRCAEIDGLGRIECEQAGNCDDGAGVEIGIGTAGDGARPPGPVADGNRPGVIASSHVFQTCWQIYRASELYRSDERR